MNNPHDKLFKETMIRRENAVSYFRNYLPKHITSQVDWRTLKIVKETFITPELKERFSDIIYEIRVKGIMIFIYFLFEHQSRPDNLMPLRFHHYMGELWELYLKQNPGKFKLPIIIPILFYHGEEKWNISIQFQDMIINPGMAQEYVPRFKYIIKDLSKFKDSEIRGNVNIRLYFTVKKYIHLPDFKKNFVKMIPLFVELSKKQTGMEYLATVLRYIYDVRDDIEPKEIEAKLINAFDEDKKEDIMTAAERLRKEGEKRGEIKGEKRGEIKGKIEVYKELLANGLLPKKVAEQKIAELNKKLNEFTEQVQKAA